MISRVNLSYELYFVKKLNAIFLILFLLSLETRTMKNRWYKELWILLYQVYLTVLTT